MAFLWARNKQKSAMDLTKSTNALLQKVSAEEKLPPKVEEELAQNLAQMKVILQGTPESEVSHDHVAQLMQALLHEHLLLSLANTIWRLPFESRKDAQVIFSNAFRWKPPGSQAAEPPALHYVVKERPEIIVALCRGYDKRESVMACGGVLREALKFDAIAALILYDEPSVDGKARDIHSLDPSVPSSGNGIFWKFFDWIDKGAFEVSADAFQTFRDILTKHKQLTAGYLQTNFDLFFTRYHSSLIRSDSYVTKRQSIKLLGEMLLERANFSIMTAYVQSSDHLKIIMMLLRDDRKMINYEAFHVFKVFVANPNKSVAVQRVLINNRERLLRFLPTFLDDRTDDDQFNDEKSFLINAIENLPPQPVAPPQPA